MVDQVAHGQDARLIACGEGGEEVGHRGVKVVEALFDLDRGHQRRHLLGDRGEVEKRVGIDGAAAVDVGDAQPREVQHLALLQDEDRKTGGRVVDPGFGKGGDFGDFGQVLGRGGKGRQAQGKGQGRGAHRGLRLGAG